MPPASGDNRYALIIAVSTYQSLDPLEAPARDAEDLRKVLTRPDIGDFRAAEVLLDPGHATAQQNIEEFFRQRDPLDIAVLHFSGHAFRGEGHDELFLAMRDTNKGSPLATAVSGDFLRRVLEQSPARRKLVLLDCCHSGALLLTRAVGDPRTRAPVGPDEERARAAEIFAAGVKRIAPPEQSEPHANATGTVIIGAARATELAHETDTGALTGAIVHGLRTGEADLNRTGQISTENLFDYATNWFSERGLKQHPVVQQRSRSGRFIVARNPAFQPLALPDDVEWLRRSDNPADRVQAVRRLGRMAGTDDDGLAETALRQLRQMHEFDLDDEVVATAQKALRRLSLRVDPGRVRFGRVSQGARTPHRTVRVVAPSAWTADTPDGSAVIASRHGDRLEITLDTARARRVNTTVRLESAAGTAEVRVTGRIRRPVRQAQPPDPGPDHPGAHPKNTGRRWLTAVLAAVLVVTLLTSFHLVRPIAVLGPCLPRDDLRVLTTDALRDVVEAAAAGFTASAPDASPPDECSPVRVTVSSVVSDGAAEKLFADQWPDTELRTAGPSPDVWLPESSIRVGLAQAAIAPNAPHRMELPDPATRSVASSPLVVAVPASVPLAGPLDRADVLARPWIIPRADPSVSSAGLLATIALHGSDDASKAEQRLERSQGGADARYDLCAHRLSTEPPPDDVAFLVPRKYVTDYSAGKPLGAACRASQDPPLNRRLRAVPISGAPGLDMPCLPILESAWGDERQWHLAEGFCGYLRGEGQAILQAHGLDPPDPAAARLLPDPAAAKDVIDAWAQAEKPVRLLLAMDVSGSMRLPMPGARTSRIQASKDAARRALAGRALREADQVGLWEFATQLDGDRDHRQRVPLANATADQLTRLAAALDDLAATDKNTGLYDTIAAGIVTLAGGRRGGADPARVDLLVVLTDGENDDRDSASLSQIAGQLRQTGVHVSVIASLGANCRTFQPLIKEGLNCFDVDRGGLDAAFDQALPGRRAA